MEIFRKRLFYRSTHRGMKEMDVILGRFAAQYLHILSKEQLTQYEKLLDEQDQDIYDWIMGSALVPVHIDVILISLMRQIIQP